MEFNPNPSYIMHIDINSCFATIEQQANPLLRGKPTVVAAYTSPGGCILAASIEAKKLGIKTGMRVKDGQAIFPSLVVLPSDPWKYRDVHLKLRKIVSSYTNDFSPKSIDEFVLNMKGYPKLVASSMQSVAYEIKQRIKTEIGEWITVSIGIAPNRYLAKIGAGIHKPDGLDEINKDNYLEVFKKLKLTDLTGIKRANEARLNSIGIFSVIDFYNAPIWKLKIAFKSITSLYWHQRLHGYEIDDFESKRSSFGNSVALGKTVIKKEEIAPILFNLVEKMSAKLRNTGYKARGVHLALWYKNGSFWHEGGLTPKLLFDSRDIFKVALRLLNKTSFKYPVRNIAVSVFDLNKEDCLQLDFFDDMEKKESLMKAVDSVNNRYGGFVIKSGRILLAKQQVLDRIAFGGIKELNS